VLLASDNVLLGKRKEIADFMAEQRIPAIYPFREYAAVGGLFIPKFPNTEGSNCV
jgi:hypothetical protein